MAYQNVATGELRYGTNECGDWAYETIDITAVSGSNQAGVRPALALDSNDLPAIVHWDGNNNQILLSQRNADKSWTTTVAQSSMVPFDLALAFDSEDKIHIAYGSQLNDQLYHLTNE